KDWRAGMTWDKLLAEMDRTIRFPGMPNIWWMPIQTRTEMLATGIRSVLGVKVYGPDLTEIRRIARETEGAVATVPGTRSAFAELADIGFSTSPPSIRDEDGQLVGYVFVDVAGRDLGSYVEEAKRVVAERVQLPPGYHLGWAGQFEYFQRASARLRLVVPFTLLIIFVLLHVNTASVTKT